MLQISVSNLWKRKLRSALTIIGVMIGVASIVIMVSLGMGLSRSMMEEYESYGSLTQITVSTPYSVPETSTEYRLTDDQVAEFSAIEHVESVYPELETYIYSVCGAYTAMLQLKGLPDQALEDLDLNIGEGQLPSSADGELKLFYGGSVLTSYSISKTGANYYTTGVMPNIDLMNDAVFTVFDVNNYNTGSSTGVTDSNTTPAKKYVVPACGMENTSESVQSGSINSYYVYCNIDALKTKLKQVFRNKPIYGQPVTKSGKAYSQIFYSYLLVNVDEMKNVMEVQNYIKDLGYEAYSSTEWIESNIKTMQLVEGVLGGIAAVSLLVAAIGIVNTMMMSIYERTKEIGVMKVLGCSLENIRTMFLIEAGMIGFVGGVAGVIVSLIGSQIINYISKGREFMGMQGGSTGLSVVPFWLVLVSIVFAVIVAMAAGLLPSQKAMRLSPLAAIRNE